MDYCQWRKIISLQELVNRDGLLFVYFFFSIESLKEWYLETKHLKCNYFTSNTFTSRINEAVMKSIKPKLRENPDSLHLVQMFVKFLQVNDCPYKLITSICTSTQLVYCVYWFGRSTLNVHKTFNFWPIKQFCFFRINVRHLNFYYNNKSLLFHYLCLLNQSIVFSYNSNLAKKSEKKYCAQEWVRRFGLKLS